MSPIVERVVARLLVGDVDHGTLALDALDPAHEVCRERVRLFGADAPDLALVQAERAERHIRRALLFGRKLDEAGVVVALFLESARVYSALKPLLGVGVGRSLCDAAAEVLLLLGLGMLDPLEHLGRALQGNRRRGDTKLVVGKDILRRRKAGHVNELSFHLGIDLLYRLDGDARSLSLVKRLRRLDRVALVPEEHREAENE